MQVLKQGLLYKQPQDEGLGRTHARLFVLQSDALRWYKPTGTAVALPPPRGTIQLNRDTVIEEKNGKLSIGSCGHRLVLTERKPWYSWNGPPVSLDGWRQAIQRCVAALETTPTTPVPSRAAPLPIAAATHPVVVVSPLPVAVHVATLPPAAPLAHSCPPHVPVASCALPSPSPPAAGLDVNSASAAELEALPGIGEGKAAAIGAPCTAPAEVPHLGRRAIC
jgi:hypothetical protein